MNNYDSLPRGHSAFDRDHDAYQIDPTSYGHQIINDAIADDLQYRPVYDKIKGTSLGMNGATE